MAELDSNPSLLGCLLGLILEPLCHINADDSVTALGHLNGVAPVSTSHIENVQRWGETQERFDAVYILG